MKLTPDVNFTNILGTAYLYLLLFDFVIFMAKENQRSKICSINVGKNGYSEDDRDVVLLFRDFYRLKTNVLSSNNYSVEHYERDLPEKAQVYHSSLKTFPQNFGNFWNICSGITMRIWVEDRVRLNLVK